MIRGDASLLAYVFWHWRREGIAADDYEGRQHAFHRALGAAPSAGFLGSFSVGLSNAPWAASGGEAYEDWYLVEDFGSLGNLNEAAVSKSRMAPHDGAASVAAGGAAGVYGLRCGEALRQPHVAHWFSKPTGMPYGELLSRLAPVVSEARGALWMRQMVLGPAREFCLHAASRLSTLDAFDPLVVPLRGVWPGELLP